MSILRNILLVSLSIGLNVSFSCLTHASLTEELDSQINSIDSCIQSTEYKSVAVLDSATQLNTFSGWNHANTQSAEFHSLARQQSAYATDASAWVENPDCAHDNTIKPTLNTVLAVKLNDWTRQHVNGLEAVFDAVTVNDIQAIRLIVNIDPARSQLPDANTLADFYGDVATDQQRRDLDNGRAHLGIVLFANGALDQNSRSLNLSTVVEIRPTNMAADWLEIVIPLEQFTAYFEQNYQRELVSLSEVGKHNLVGLRLVAETKNGKQLRNLLNEKNGKKWTETLPEAFKELALSLSDVRLLLLSE